MDVRQFAFLARQPSAALQSRHSFWGLPKRGLAFMLANLMFWQPLWVMADGIVVNGSGTRLDQAGNGVPIVNIAKPNGGGLSHNKFSDYNVGPLGVILNNATSRTQETQLGGIILGNPNLGGRSATVILNEVNGGSPSQLKGYTEVAGKSAHVIVANPYGVTCNGCGFINTPKATLTTGKPVIENGQVQRYQVDQGSVAIEGAGLNASNIDQFEIITRSARINAEIQARQLAVIAGANDVDAKTLNTTARTANPADAPQLAIDSSALGGMYAGAIKLVGTEAGVGVKLAGNMAASGGDLQIDANGQLTLARAQALGDVQLKAQAVQLTESVYAQQNAKVVATDQLTVDKNLTAGGNLHLEGRQMVSHGQLNAGLKQQEDVETVNPASHLQLQGGSLTNTGTINAQGSLGIDLEHLDNQGAELVAARDLRLKAGSVDNRGGTLAAAQSLKVTVDSLDNRDHGLMFSKSAGLTLSADSLDNRQGTLQANQGELKVRVEQVLDNGGGKIFTGAGDLVLEVDELRNQQGRLNAQGGKLSVKSTVFDNRQGNAQAEAVEVTSRTRLINDQGHLLATAGDLSLKGGEVRNNGGEIASQQHLGVEATSLQNQHGSISAETIGLGLTGKLDNAAGLIESRQRLAVDAGSLSNAKGRLRALGEQGESRFSIGGRFDNDLGLVEIGNQRLRLSSVGLSNQQGLVRHLGQQGFELSLADTGNAGGSFITNSRLDLDLAEWSNTSLIQAQKIGLKVGTFTQAGSGKLVSVESIDASGHQWINDGSLETDGDLKLTLSGSYQGNGSLKSQGRMSVTAASADLGQEAQVRSGGAAVLALGSHLQNLGSLTASGDLLLKVDSLTQQGTLGAGNALQIETATLLNQGGLIFSGADMQLETHSLTNDKGDIYSLGRLNVNGPGQQSASLIENISGTLESAHGMQLLANRLVNRKERFAFIPALTSGRITLHSTDNCKGRHCEAYYSVKEVYDTTITEDSPRANLISGAELTFKGDSFENRFSTVAAAGNISLQSNRLSNIGAGGGEIRHYSYGIYTRDEGAYYNFINNIRRYNAFNNPASASYDPTAIPLKAIAIGRLSGFSKVATSGNGDVAAAVIQGAGNVDITGAQYLENSVIRPGETVVTRDSRVGLTTVDSSTQVQPQLNLQAAPDLQQQAVNPLALPGFSLPQGESGLFKVSSDPQHKYLIETNPAFANLKQFLNSDYLLSRIGFNSDQTQRRLGDGLYEQRLIREALIARTGQRFIAGLDSDEAMFRYLMDNAIASKTALELSPGVALTSAQIAALTHDIVWMQEQEVNGEKVLVPVLYMAQAHNRLAPNGALIQGRDLNLISGGTLANQGTLRASTQLQARAQNIDNSGLIEANERLSLLARQSIRNAQGGILKGQDVSLVATEGDVINERSKASLDTGYGGGRQHNDYLNSAARVEAGNRLDIAAGRDIRNSGSVLQAMGDMSLKAGRDLTLVATEQVNTSSGRHKKTSWSQSRTTQYGSEVRVGGNLSATAGQDLQVVASQVMAQGSLALAAMRDASIEAAAHERHRASKSKKVTSSNDQVRLKASSVTAGGDLSITAGQDLTLVASQVKGEQNVALNATRDLNLLSAKNESASFYSKKSKGSFGRSSSKQQESYHSTNIASVVEAGKDLTLNTSKKADGGMSINGGRDVTVIGSQLKSGADLMVGATGDVAVLSGVEEHGSYSKKSKSGFLGLSKSGKSQLQATATQVGSELSAGNDVVLAAGNDIRLRASEATAGNDVELRAGLVNDSGDINLVSANDSAYSRSVQYKKKVGLSSSGASVSFASAKESGRQAQSSTSVGSQVLADRDASLKAEREINVVGSGISAGRNVSLDAGRDVNVLAAQNSSAEQDWKKSKQVGVGVSSDDNGVSFFAGAELNKEKNRVETQTAAASQISAGADLSVNAKRDINQIGSDLKAVHDINLVAGRDIKIDAAQEVRVTEQQRESERNGLGVTLNHNYGKTKDAVNGTGDGENNVSKASSTFKAIDSVSQFLAGPTADVKLGNSKQSSSQEIIEQGNRSSTLHAGNDLNLTANNDVTVKGSQLGAGRDINVKGRDVTLDVAKSSISKETRNTESWGGIHGGTSGGFKIGVGGSFGTASTDSSQGSSTVPQLDAGRDINLKTSNDLNLIGTQAQAGRNIDLDASNDLNIRAAQNDQSSENNRNSGGGEVGFTFGSEGAGVYASVSMGKGNLERESERQQEAYLYAGDRLGLTSGKDTNISGANLRGDEVIGRVGGDLNVASVADTGKVKGKEFDISVTATFGPAPGLSGSVGYGQTTGKTDWVEEQTRITGKNKVDIRTENHTQIDGALIAADNGNLKLDTGTLGFSDIAGKEKEHGYYLNVGGTYSSGSGTTQDSSQVGKGKEGETGWSVSGWDYQKDREQIVRATVGAGDIVVRKDAETGGDSTAGLNRDVSKAYEITKDEESRTDLYASSSSLGAVASPKQTYEQWKKSAELYGEKSQEAMVKLVLLLGSMGVLVASPSNVQYTSEDINKILVETENHLKTFSKDENRRSEAIEFRLREQFGDLSSDGEKLLLARMKDIARESPEKSVELAVMLASLRKPSNGSLNLAAAPAAGVMGALAAALVYSVASPQTQENMRYTANSVVESAKKSGGVAKEEVQRQLKISIGLWELVTLTAFPIHLLDDENRKLINPIVDTSGGNPASGGYAEGGGVITTPPTGGTQLDGVQKDGAYVTPEHKLNPGAMYSESDKKIVGWGADNPVNQSKLISQLIAEEVANGHAFNKHVLERKEFVELGVNTKDQFQRFVEGILANPATERRQSVDGTMYYLDNSTRTIVIRGRRGEATAFRPDQGGVGWDNYIKAQVPKK